VCRLSFLVALICLPLITLAQSQFAGRWQTKTSRVTGKPTITMNIVESQNKLSGIVVLVNPDRSEMEMPILSSELKGTTLEFETKLQGTPFDWRWDSEEREPRSTLARSHATSDQDAAGMLIDRTIGFADCSQTEVVGPAGQHPVKLLHHCLWIQSDRITSGLVADRATDALHSFLGWHRAQAASMVMQQTQRAATGI
jgi:hypothetical protein